MVAPPAATGLRLIIRSTSSGRENNPKMNGTSGIGTNGSTVSLPLREPMIPSSIPTSAEMMPRTIAPRLSTTTIAMPSVPVAATSEKLKRRTNGRATGMTTSRIAAPTTPPRAETA